MARGSDIVKDLDHEGFVREFLIEFLENGLGTLPKRELDLLVLSLLVEFRKSWKVNPPSDYQIGRTLGISPRKVRSMLDEISFRDETKDDAWCQSRLREILIGAEKLYATGNRDRCLDDCTFNALC